MFIPTLKIQHFALATHWVAKKKNILLESFLMKVLSTIGVKEISFFFCYRGPYMEELTMDFVPKKSSCASYDPLIPFLNREEQNTLLNSLLRDSGRIFEEDLFNKSTVRDLIKFVSHSYVGWDEVDHYGNCTSRVFNLRIDVLNKSVTRTTTTQI